MTAKKKLRKHPKPSGSAREWEARATEYFQLNAPHGACATCKWLRPEDPPTAEKSHWCILVEGTCRDQDCHLCPGVNPPNDQAERQEERRQ